MQTLAPRNIFTLMFGVLLAIPFALGIARLAASGLSVQGDHSTLADGLYGDLPFVFEPAAGRYGPGVHFAAQSGAGSAYLTSEGLTLTSQTSKRSAEAITIAPLGAELSDAAGRSRLEGVVNDLRGDNPSRWETELPTFERVRYQGAYPGIDLDFHGSQGALEYDFRVAPQADPAQISLAVRDADSLRLESSGDLRITSGEASFTQKAPVAYQPSPNGRIPVDSAFTLDGRTLGFSVGAYDRDRRLVVDPLTLTYSTYLGGNAYDSATGIAVDASGSAYVAGSTYSTDFNINGQIEGDSSEADAFISKLNPAGNALVYSTYLGGSSHDDLYAIAIDSAGAAYVAGGTRSTDFNTVGPIEGDSGDHENSTDAFISKLNPAGNALVYSTYLGGYCSDDAYAIAVDTSGAAYVAGETCSGNLNTVNPIETFEPNTPADTAAFISKLNPAGNALVYSTFLGGDTGEDISFVARDQAAAIAVDAAGAAYVTGSTNATDFNTVGPIEGNSPGYDAFVSKLNPAGSALIYSTYLGGDSHEEAAGIAVDGSGSAYVSGYTDSTDFNTVGAIEGDSPEWDAFISKLNPVGNALVYSTYLGGDNFDWATGIDVDASGNAYVAGTTHSTDFNTVEPIEGDTEGSDSDAFVSKLNPAGNVLAWSTYLGGRSGEDEALSADGAGGIAVDTSGDAYVTGRTGSTDFNTVGPIEGNSAGDDAFISKLRFGPDNTPPETEITKGPPDKTQKVKAKFRFSGTDDVTAPSALEFRCRIDEKALTDCASPKEYKNLKRGKHAFEVFATDGAGNQDPTPAKWSWKVKRG